MEKSEENGKWHEKRKEPRCPLVKMKAMTSYSNEVEALQVISSSKPRME
jgi:hypothetical protein